MPAAVAAADGKNAPQGVFFDCRVGVRGAEIDLWDRQDSNCRLRILSGPSSGLAASGGFEVWSCRGYCGHGKMP